MSGKKRSFTKVYDSELEIFEHLSKNFEKGCRELLFRVHRKFLRKKVQGTLLNVGICFWVSS